ncbi:hypothetical protein CQS04_13055 [Chryseomicrobium excrementi]|uniref:Uncharacterized protein n=1 Tax=Chryseomicrobium excrementi TaxID=2041346 RepID=A0A2M9EWN8_9BACL|nr:hypothetical protein CQS04_13055 [Chryseomicrobium excrementi]
MDGSPLGIKFVIFRQMVLVMDFIIPTTPKYVNYVSFKTFDKNGNNMILLINDNKNITSISFVFPNMTQKEQVKGISGFVE